MSISRNGPIARFPPVAALMRISNGACCLKNASMAVRSSTSHFASVTPAGGVPALLGSRLTAKTLAPSAASCLVVARPMPDVPPKTIAFLPSTFIAVFSVKKMFEWGKDYVCLLVYLKFLRSDAVMPRRARLSLPGIPWDIILRGNNRGLRTPPVVAFEFDRWDLRDFRNRKPSEG